LKQLMYVFSLLLIVGFWNSCGHKNPRAVIETSHGTIVIELYADQAPLTVENFIQYAENGFYEGTTFHRIVKGFVIQGGGLTPDMEEKETLAAIPNEASNGLSNLRGTIAMARTPDPHSATSQFFINTVDNQRLDHSSKTPRGWGYCVFGQVIEGMDIVDIIANLPVTKKGLYENVPSSPVIIHKVTIR